MIKTNKPFEGSSMFSTQAYAKVNLFLYVTEKRSDGYHNIYSLLVPINIFDTITITYASSTKLTCTDISIQHKNNTILKTDNILRSQYSLTGNFHIHLDKKIPYGSGLGGGSSDAAAYLKLVNKAAKLNLSNNDMFNIMAQVGSDTIFFLQNKPAIVSGRGEIIEKTIELPKLFFLIINPNINISTKQIYTDKYLVLTNKDLLLNLKKLNSINDVKNIMHNDMEKVVFRKYPIVREIINKLNIETNGKAIMSGSGSTVFSVYDNEKDINEAYLIMKNMFPNFFIKKAKQLINTGD